jgi:hypothetical protein
MTDADNTTEPDVEQADTAEGTLQDNDTPEASEETFSREYVEGLRRENGKYRQRAQKGDEYAQRLHTELVRATGRLADPTDLPFDEGHVADADTMAAAIEDLLKRKPHLASRRPTGEIGQGPSPSAANVDLAAILRGKAG